MPINLKTLSVLAALGTIIFRLPAQAAPADAFQIGGAVAKPTAWSVTSLRAEMPGKIQSITYRLKNVPHHAHAISLLTLIDAAQPNFHAQIKNHRLQFTLAVQGRDGYTVDFSLAELLPQFGNHAVWVALDEDDNPPAADAGPMQLIVPDDVKPGRWVHALTRVTVVDGEQQSAPAKS